MEDIVAESSGSDTAKLRFQNAASNVTKLLQTVEVITDRRNTVLTRWENFKGIAADRRKKLEASRAFQQFMRNSDELNAWITEKLTVATDMTHLDATNLQGKIKKHQAFEAEVTANEGQLTSIQTTGRELIEGSHYASDAITTTLNALEDRWAELRLKSTEKGENLDHAFTLLTFRREVDEVMAWITEKKVIASSEDTGKDLEHVDVLQKRFEDFSNDLAGNELRIEAVHAAATKLVDAGHPETDRIQERRTEIDEEWAALKDLAAVRKQKLADARLIHALNRDADEIASRINEKAVMLSSDDNGKDLASVEALQRKHDGFTRDLAALGESVNKLAGEADDLSSRFPEYSESVVATRQEISSSWDSLQDQAKTRKTTLDQAYDLQRFLNDFRNSTSWISDMKALISADELARDVAGSESLLQRHEEHKGEIDARQDSFRTVTEFGDSLIDGKHYASEDIQAKLDDLAGERTALQELWDAKKQQFDQCHDLQLFLRDAEHVNAWISAHEATLSNEDLGDSLDSVEALIKKHDDFEKSLAAQEEKTNSLDDFASRLIGYGHYDAEAIKEKREEVLARRAALDDAAKARRSKLEESRRLQQLLRDVGEAEAWVTEKLQTASDESYREQTNLRGKLQNHQAFEAELLANEGRITAVRDAGEALVGDGHYAADQIVERMGTLDATWAELRAQSADKLQKLKEANQQQQFNRRVEDIEAWCGEAEAALLSEDLGKDLTSVQNLTKKHQLLEAEIAGHKDRVEAVCAQADEFVAAGNFQADEIAARKDTLAARYAALAEPAAARRARLAEAHTLQQFYRDVDDEESWIKEKEPGASSTNYGTSLTAVQNLQKKHNALQAELSGRHKAVAAVQESADALVAGGHYAAETIAQRAADLQANWQNLNAMATSRKEALDDSLKTQQFHADCNEAEAWMAEKAPVVSIDDHGKDEDSALALLKKHEALEADLKTYRSTIEALQKESAQCKDIVSTGEATPRSSPTRKALAKARAVADHAPAGPGEVALAKGDIVSVLAREGGGRWRVSAGDASGLVPEACLEELSAAGASGGALNQSLLERQGGAPEAQTQGVLERAAGLGEQYDGLLGLAAERRNRLEESQQLYQLNREMDEVESWINDREAVASVEDLGNDLEHNEAIQKKFDDFLKDLATNEARVRGANELADRFVQQGHSDTPAIQERKQALNERWGTLQAVADARSAALGKAHEIHKFKRDVDETKARLNEKDVVLSSDDYGRDVASVEALQRKHEGAMRDLAALSVKVTQLQGASARLVEAQPGCEAEVAGKQAEVDASWASLQAKAEGRKGKLDESLSLQQFLSQHRDLTSWLSGVRPLAASDEVAKDAGGAQALVKRHQELRTKIDARSEGIAALRAFGEKLAGSGHYAAAEIQDKLACLDADLDGLNADMDSRRSLLDQCAELQAFNRIAEHAEAWITTREPTLQSRDVGATLDGVEAMQKKHADFEKSLAAHKEKINEVDREADRLVAADHYDKDSIAARKAVVNDKWQNIMGLSEARKAKLGDALLLQQFHRDCDEAEAWVHEKSQVANDPTFKDPTNLQGKLQKHQAFEAEVEANNERINGVIRAGKQLAGEHPEEADNIRGRLSQLEEQWALLKDGSSGKGQKLKEATDQQEYNHGTEEIEFWLAEMESLLGSKDTGKDLPSVQSLIKKHELVEANILAHRDRVDKSSALADGFIRAGHFDAEAIQANRDKVVQRYEAVVAKAKERGALLQDSLQLQQLLRDVDDEESWIKEKERIAASVDFGKDLTGVQNLQKKHQTFAGELDSHEVRVRAVISEADRLIQDRHYAADDIAARQQQLQAKWQNLKDLSEGRKSKLNESLEYQVYNADVDEEESWINEKLNMMSSEDTPDTLSGAQALVKKQEAFGADLQEHQERVQVVLDAGTRLVEARNYQADLIQESNQQLREATDELARVAANRKVTLNDRFKMLQFSREADSIEAWINDKEPQALSKDYGKDLPSVQSLIAKHSTFDASLAAFQPRIASFLQLRDELEAQIAGASKGDVSARAEGVNARWGAVQQAAEERTAKLRESQSVFQQVEDLFLEFAQKASQFNSWFENAEEDLTDPVRVNSLDEIQSLRAAHGHFMDSLADARGKFDQLKDLDRKIKAYNVSSNPYTWFTIETLDDSWTNLSEVIRDRSDDLVKEQQRQEDNEKLRELFAKHANEFSAWLSQTRSELVEGSGTLEAQLEATKGKYAEILRKKAALKNIEDLGAKMEEALILDNKFTEHSTVGLAQQWDQLEQLGMRMQHNLEQQIQAKNTTGVSEEQIKEFNETFRYFDKDRSGRLDHQELKSCLRSLGYSLPVVEEGESDPEFEAILVQLDPNMDGYVGMAEFMSFMISRETENVESASEVINAFKAAAGDKPYVTPAELHKALTPEQAEYCIRHMKSYVDPNNIEIDGGLDYRTFTQGLFL